MPLWVDPSDMLHVHDLECVARSSEQGLVIEPRLRDTYTSVPRNDSISSSDECLGRGVETPETIYCPHF